MQGVQAGPVGHSTSVFIVQLSRRAYVSYLGKGSTHNGTIPKGRQVEQQPKGEYRGGRRTKTARAGACVGRAEAFGQGGTAAAGWSNEGGEGKGAGRSAAGVMGWREWSGRGREKTALQSGVTGTTVAGGKGRRSPTAACALLGACTKRRHHSSGFRRTTRVAGARLLPVPSRLRLPLRGVCRRTACISVHVRPGAGGVDAAVGTGRERRRHE